MAVYIKPLRFTGFITDFKRFKADSMRISGGLHQTTAVYWIYN